MLKLGWLQAPVRRVLALDPGSRRMRLLLAEAGFGSLQVIKQELIDLEAEGLVSADETRAHVQTLLDGWGRPPLALVLPQHQVTSQIIDLPPGPESEVDKQVREETVKLSGVSDSRIVYDYVRTETEAKNRQQFWVTICPEGSIRERIVRLGIESEDLCEVTTASNALVTAYREAVPDAARAILVHLGAQSTVVVILLGGKAAYATSFQMGSDFFTRTLARLMSGTESAAEAVKRKENLLGGPGAAGEFVAAVDGWVNELKRQLNEWFADNPAMAAEVATFRMVASGAGFNQPGLLDYLKEQADLDFQPWPAGASGAAAQVEPGFEIAFGTALQALGRSPQPVSLLPDDFREAWKKRLLQQRLEFGSLMLLVICALLLAAGTWHKKNLIQHKQTLLTKTTAAQEAFDAAEALNAEMVSGYETLRPLFAAEQNSRDLLKSLALLEQSRSNRALWYAVVSDQYTYFNPPANFIPTNRPAKTNIASSASASSSSPERLVPLGPYLPATNTASAKPGCIVELSMPEAGESGRTILSQVVNELKHQSVFSKVDSLSDDLRRNLAEPNVVLPDRYFVLALDFSETDFQRSPRPHKPPSGRPPGSGKRPARPAASFDALEGRANP